MFFLMSHPQAAMPTPDTPGSLGSLGPGLGRLIDGDYRDVWHVGRIFGMGFHDFSVVLSMIFYVCSNLFP